VSIVGIDNNPKYISWARADPAQPSRGGANWLKNLTKGQNSSVFIEGMIPYLVQQYISLNSKSRYYPKRLDRDPATA